MKRYVCIAREETLMEKVINGTSHFITLMLAVVILLIFAGVSTL